MTTLECIFGDKPADSKLKFDAFFHFAQFQFVILARNISMWICRRHFKPLVYTLCKRRILNELVNLKLSPTSVKWMLENLSASEEKIPFCVYAIMKIENPDMNVIDSIISNENDIQETIYINAATINFPIFSELKKTAKKEACRFLCWSSMVDKPRMRCVRSNVCATGFAPTLHSLWELVAVTVLADTMFLLFAVSSLLDLFDDRSPTPVPWCSLPRHLQ